MPFQHVFSYYSRWLPWGTLLHKVFLFIEPPPAASGTLVKRTHTLGKLSTEALCVYSICMCVCVCPDLTQIHAPSRFPWGLLSAWFVFWCEPLEDVTQNPLAEEQKHTSNPNEKFIWWKIKDHSVEHFIWIYIELWAPREIWSLIV